MKLFTYYRVSVNFANMFRLILLFGLIFIKVPIVLSANFTDGLILYHTYDEGEGEIAKDLSGNGHDGKIEQPNWVDGKYKNALQFKGAGSGTYVTVENTDTLNVNECTFMAWINAETWDGTRQIVGKSVHGGCSGRGQYGLFSEKVYSNSALKLKKDVWMSMLTYLQLMNGYTLHLQTMEK